MHTTDNAREAHVRRTAAREGLRAEKSRTRNPQAAEHDGWMLVDATTNAVVAGGTPFAYNLSLADVERHLQDLARPGDPIDWTPDTDDGRERFYTAETVDHPLPGASYSHTGTDNAVRTGLARYVDTTGHEPTQTSVLLDGEALTPAQARAIGDELARLAGLAEQTILADA